MIKKKFVTSRFLSLCMYMRYRIQLCCVWAKLMSPKKQGKTKKKKGGETEGKKLKAPRKREAVMAEAVD